MAIAMAPGLSSVQVYEGPTPLDEPPMGTNYTQDADNDLLRSTMCSIPCPRLAWPCLSWPSN